MSDTSEQLQNLIEMRKQPVVNVEELAEKLAAALFKEEIVTAFAPKLLYYAVESSNLEMTFNFEIKKEEADAQSK